MRIRKNYQQFNRTRYVIRYVFVESSTCGMIAKHSKRNDNNNNNNDYGE